MLRAQVREWISPARFAPEIVLAPQPPTQPHRAVIVARTIGGQDGTLLKWFAQPRSVPLGADIQHPQRALEYTARGNWLTPWAIFGRIFLGNMILNFLLYNLRRKLDRQWRGP